MCAGRQRLDEKSVRTTDGQRKNLPGHSHSPVEVGHKVRGMQPVNRGSGRQVRVGRNLHASRPRGRRT